MIRFKCKRCGKCCKNATSLFLTSEEVKKWKKLVVRSNFGVFRAIDFASVIESTGTADLFFHPTTGEELSRCPFLRKLSNQEKYQCLIQHVKPLVCKIYPFSVNGEVVGKNCPGLT